MTEWWSRLLSSRLADLAPSILSSYTGSPLMGGSPENIRAGGGSVRNSTLNFDNVVARAAISNLSFRQVAHRQRDNISSQIQRFDAAFNGRVPTTAIGASGSGAAYSAWLYGVGAQFAVDSSGLSGEQRTINCGK